MKRPAHTSIDHSSVARDNDTDDHSSTVRELFREHNRALLNFLRARLRSDQEALDVAQEAYVRLLQLHQPGAVSFLRGYLFKIAANLSVDVVRRRDVRERTAAELCAALEPCAEVEPRAISRQEFEAVCAALEELPQRHRHAFVRHIVEGYSTPEIAREMQVDERTVRKFVARALLHCRQRLGRDEAGRGA